MYKNILVAIDLSEHNEKVLEKAKVLSERLGAKLFLIHAVEPLPVMDYAFMLTEEMLQKILADTTIKIHQRGKHYGVPESQQYVELDFAKSAILNKANEIKADLIIVGSHTKTTLVRLLGSIASAIVHRAEQDVLVVSC
jgi:universal stress protein A